MIPVHYLQDRRYQKSLRAYVQDYLKEEVFHEGLIRNLPAFSRFFDAMGYSHGELTNFSNIARECGVDSKTVKEYYQILVDTLLGNFVEPFKRRQNRKVISKASKFYLFDVGVAGSITKRNIEDSGAPIFDKNHNIPKINLREIFMLISQKAFASKSYAACPAKDNAICV